MGPATAQVLLHRGMAQVAEAQAFLDPRLSGLTPPHAMADRDVAADRLAFALRRHERIAVFGDYDVDGTTSAAILADVLEALGADVVALVANRFAGGYGFGDEALTRCLETGARLVVTCDCGSSDHQRIARARDRGVDVIVVDHHLVPPEPLPALAFLNPHRPECGFPYKGLASAGLVLSVGAAVRAKTGARLDLRAWLDLVALGTIADVAPLDGDNRRLVRAGLRLLGAEQGRPGVVALREVASLRPGPAIGSSDVAFRLAPRLNAAGRLGDPALTLALLRARSMPEARGLAARIEQLNQERRAIERGVTEAAFAQVEAVYGAEPRGGVVVAGEGWHRGVVGITAARLVDRLGVPVVAVALEGEMGHGSARGPDGCRLYDALTRCRGDLTAFGGHQAAAGLSVRASRIDALRASFSDATSALGPASAGDGAGDLPLVDVVLDGRTFPLPTVADLVRLEPMGEANAAPLFAVSGARIDRAHEVGEGHLKLRLRVGAQVLGAFGRAMAPAKGTLGETLNALGHVRPDTFRGGDAVEMHLTQIL